MRFQSIVAKISFAAFAVALAVALVASFGTRLGLWSYKLGLFAILPATALGSVGLLAGLVWALTALVRNSGTGVRFGIVGLLGAILTVGVPLNGLRLAL